MADNEQLERFIARWQAADGSERANYQLFLTELCRLLDLPHPENAGGEYVFERRVTFRHGDGSESHGFIDLYRRGAFVCEAKRTDKEIGTGTWDQAMLRARAQAESYARALPAEEGRPPFLLVTDVGRSIELYSEFTRSGATYVPFPDPRSHRIALNDLRREDIRARLAQVWVDPLALDPARQSAKVTREIAGQLAQLARSFEGAGHTPETVSAFLMRCLFTMFAEDVGLLPAHAFTELLLGFRDDPAHLHLHLTYLWQAMNSGGYAVALRADVLRFNGGLFADPSALPMNRGQLDLLIAAARADWKHVEPAIFGTLLERALDPIERHALGAQYTPRAYVERLILPTVMEPLRNEWANAQAAALTLVRQGKTKDAVAEVKAFHRRLTQVRVLDPACGSGNFLYVTLEHLKRLEGEVLTTLEDMGETQGLLELAGVTVDPHQLLGLELNPRAARVAEAVLWIGYLQWHFRTRGNVIPPEPVLKDFHNIEHRDAVLDYDRVEYVTGESGRPVMRWDGRTMKKHPVTGEDVPDETAQVPLERYVNPRRAQWPEADFVVGNPPFIGTKRMRAALGDGYVDALRGIYEHIPDSADFVMYWWDRAAELTGQARLRRFGLITTNSLTQSFNRRVVQMRLDAKPPVSLVYAIPDHPWVDNADGAAVRIAVTVGEAGTREGMLATVIAERESGGEGVEVTLAQRSGRLHADLRIGANIASAATLAGNAGISGMGVALHGAGFVLDPERADRIRQHGAAFVRPYLGGKDLLHAPRERYLIDFSGLGEEEARRANPGAFQHVLDYVKPERDHNRRDSIRTLWWRFGWERPLVRAAIAPLRRYIGTTETAKHRVFQFVPSEVLCDHKIICIALEDVVNLGVLSSRLHCAWALAAGGRLGVGNDPVYNKLRCLDAFPFPAATDDQRARIRTLAEELDAHRKRQQSLHPDLTLTGMYNVLEALRAGRALTAKEKAIHEQGLVSVLGELHDAIDREVFAAYGWSDLAPALVGKPGGTTPLPDKPPEQAAAEDELLSRLVALNAERAAEEARGIVRWLRPEYQTKGAAPVQEEMETVSPSQPPPRHGGGEKSPWPKTLPEQVQAVRALLSDTPISVEFAARHFIRAPRDKVAELLETLVALGQARRVGDGRFSVG